MRYRQRKDDYVKELETDMKDLQRSITSTMIEKDSLSHENMMMVKLLDSTLPGSLSPHIYEHGVSSGTDSTMASRQCHAILSLKRCSDLGGDRLAVSPTRYGLAYAGHESDVTIQRPAGDVVGDTWDAIDFVLALERPCREHVAIPSHLSNQENCDPSLHIDSDGHALTMTSAVYARTVKLPHHWPGHEGDIENASTYGYVPSFELERYERSVHQPFQYPLTSLHRLLDFSTALQLDDQYMTPIQIYAALKKRGRSGQEFRDMLERVRAPLAVSAECQGFGSVLLTDTFREIVTIDSECEKMIMP
jgi:hypothetical protein